MQLLLAVIGLVCIFNYNYTQLGTEGFFMAARSPPGKLS
jgi:hypothetical protein